MPSKNPLTTATAKEYRTKYGKTMPNLKLARIMYNENKTLFNSVEHARSLLRSAEGQAGNQNRNKRKDNALFTNAPRPKNPYNLPTSDKETFPNYIIKGHKKGLILNDIHFPYQDNEALTAALNYAKKEKPDFIFLNGDIIDVHSLSYFMKDPRKKRFSEELQLLADFIETLHKQFKCKIYFKFGNHEERYDSFLFQKAHELLGVEEFSLEAIIKKRIPKVEIIGVRRTVVIAGLPFIHGHEFGRGIMAPVNAARGLFLQAKHSAVKGDCHTTSEHVEKDIMDKMMTTWSVGCLCGLTPYFAVKNKWNHGFAMIDIGGDRKYKFRNFRIFNGEVL
jgi:predicted phosphodiesterase